MSIKTSEQFTVSRVADLVNVSAVNEQLCQTQGYYNPTDGGGNLYQYESASTATCDGGFILDGEGGDNSVAATNVTYPGTGTGRWVAVDQTVANVKQFGAKGDGVTDDTIRITAALQSSLCVVPVGTFVFTSLQVGSNSEFRGEGGILKLKDGVCIDAGVSYYLIHNLGNLGSVFKDLIVDGNKANNTLFTVADAITCVGAGSRVVGCKVTDPPDTGIMFSDVPGGICSGNIITGATDAGIYCNASAGTNDLDGSVISSNVVNDCVYGGISIKRDAAAISVVGNTIGSCGNGITCEDFGAGVDPDELVISGNILKDIGYPHRGAPGLAEVGISVQRVVNFSISDNLITNVSGVAISLSGALEGVVSANSVKGYKTSPAADNSGIVLETRTDVPSHLTIGSNVVSEFNSKGIWSKNADACAFSNNVVKGANGTSLRIDAATDNCNFSGNVLDGNATNLEYFAGALANYYHGNYDRSGTGVEVHGMRRNASFATPVGNLVPRYAGEIIHITTGNLVWMAIGTTNADWVQLT